MVTASWPWPASATKMRLVSAWSSDVSSSDRSEEHTSELQSLTNLVCRLLLRSEEHTSELQSLTNLVCRLLLEKKEHTSELQSLTNLVCRLLLEKKTSALRSEEHTSELQSLTKIVCRLLLEKKIIINFTVPEGYPSIEFQVFQFSGNNLSIESLRLNSIISERIPLRTKEVKKAVLNIIGMIVLIAFFLLFIILRFKKLVFFILFIIIAELWFLNIEHSSDILTGCAMYSPIGKLDSFMHIKANDTKEGYLAYGPYLPLEKGRYRVNYKVFLDNLDSGDDISRKVGYCDIDIEGHPELRKFSEFTVGSFKKRNPQEVSLTFSVPEGMPKTQYRVYQYGGNKLTLSSLKLYDVDITKYIRTHLDILLIAIFITIIFI